MAPRYEQTIERIVPDCVERKDHPASCGGVVFRCLTFVLGLAILHARHEKYAKTNATTKRPANLRGFSCQI
jgi:hypothetical protein